MPSSEERIKLFAMTSQLIEHDLDRVERVHAVDLRRDHSLTAEVDDAYYPQIESAIRAEAAEMAPHYEVLYSLETTIRRGVSEVLEDIDDDWWNQRVPEGIRKEVAKRQRREAESAVTPRSDDPIDFTTFGELGEIIKGNWDAFGSVFSNQKAVEKVMTSLNTVRGPIAHCSPLAEDEVLRLRLTVRDWFRLGD